MSKQVATVTELARQVKRDTGTVSRWLKRPDWPFARRGPWNTATVAKIKTWAANTLAPNPAADAIDELELPRASDRADERAAKLKILRERGARLELERKEMEGALLDRDEVEREQVARIHAVKNAMRNAGQRLAVKLAGVNDAAQIERIVEAEMRMICNAFADGRTPYADAPQAGDGQDSGSDER